MSILISWLMTESTREMAGGDSVAFEYDSVILDGTVTEGYDSQATATEHPVEAGTDITDHVKAALQAITLEVVVSAHAGPFSPVFDDSWTIDGEDDGRPARVRAILRQLIASGTEVTIETGVGSWESMLLLGFAETRNSDQGDGLRGTLTAREFRRVSTEDVEAPSPRVERGRRTSDRGRQTGDGEDGTASATPADRASTLTRLVRLGEGYLDRRGAQ